MDVFDSIFENCLQKSSIIQKISVTLDSFCTCMVCEDFDVTLLSFQLKVTKNFSHMQVFFILFSVYFAIYQYINSKCLYRTHVNLLTTKPFHYEKTISSFAFGSPIDHPKHPRLRLPIRRLVLQHHKRHHRGSYLSGVG